MNTFTFVNLLNGERHDIACSLDDNVVSIKKRLSRYFDMDEGLFQLSIDRVILNDNQIIPRNQNIISYQILDHPIQKVNLIIKKNHFNIPKWIQVDRNSTIREVKNILSIFSKDENLSTFLFDGKGEMLMDDKTVDSYALTNASKVKVWRGPNLLVTLNICNPFIKINENQPTQTIQAMKFSMTDSIVEVKRKISELLKKGKEIKLVLFTDSSYLHDGKRLIDYPFRTEGSDIFYVDLINHEEIKINDQIKKGKYAKIFKGYLEFPPQDVAVNRYKLKEKIYEKKVLKYEMVTRNQMSKANIDRFVQLISMYEDGKYFYIVTDYMERGSLKSRYLASPLQEKEIIRYSIQICEALKYMHDNKFIHRNLTCSSVLIDDNDNIKLSNFHLSKYLFSNTIEQILDGIPGSKIDTQRCWLAPEVLRNDPYGLKSDIWSLGITMMEMLTRARPYPHMNVVLATHKIVTAETIEYDRNISSNLSAIIDRCIHLSQWERPTAGQCIQLLNEITF